MISIDRGHRLCFNDIQYVKTKPRQCMYTICFCTYATPYTIFLSSKNEYLRQFGLTPSGWYYGGVWGWGANDYTTTKLFVRGHKFTIHYYGDRRYTRAAGISAVGFNSTLVIIRFKINHVCSSHLSSVISGILYISSNNNVHIHVYGKQTNSV